MSVEDNLLLLLLYTVYICCYVFARYKLFSLATDELEKSPDILWHLVWCSGASRVGSGSELAQKSVNK